MSSDSSSSDSESSCDEDLETNVFQAFEAVKRNLNSLGLNRKEKSTKTDNNLKFSSPSTRHRLIYQTFKKDDVSKNYKKKNSEQCEDVETEGVESSTYLKNNFFIDKGSTKSSNSEDNVIANDLTNISEAVELDTESQDHADIVSYDLTNFDNPDSELVGESKNTSDSSDEALDSENEKEELDHTERIKLENERKLKKKREKGLLSSRLEADVAMNDVYINVNPLGKSKPYKNVNKDKQKHKEPEVMKKSVITDDYERQDSIQTTNVSVRQQKKQRKLEREKTKGGKWYNMPATELTDERKHDLTVLQMRKALDPKRFYKANDLKATPKYFQFGQVVEDATDFYSSRIPKKQRKSNVVEELLADVEFRKFNKRKYEEIQEAKRLGKGAYKHMKRLKKRKK